MNLRLLRSLLRPVSGAFALFALFALVGASAGAATIAKEATGTANLATDGAAWVGGTAPSASDVAQWTSTSTTGTQTLDGAATWDGISLTDPSAAVTLNAGTGGTLGLGAGGIDLSSATANLTTNVPTNLDAAQVWNVGAGRSLTISGVISGAAGNSITKTGNGAIVLSNGNNSFSGAFNLNQGTLRIAGTPPGSNITSVLGTVATSVLNIQGGTVITATSGNRTLSTNTFNVFGDFTVGGPGNTSRLLLDTTMNLQGATRTITIDAGSASGGTAGLKLGFQHFTNSSAVLQITNGTLRAVAGASVSAGNNSYFGFVNTTNFTNNAGLILGANIVTYMGANNVFGTGTNVPAVTVEAGGTFDLSDQAANSRSTEIFSLSGAGPVINRTTGTGTAVLNISGGNGTTTYSGVIQNGATGSVGLTKSGASTLLLTGANTYTGATNVTGGNLIVNGSLAAGSAVTVSGTGVLGGTGSVGAVAVSAGGKVSPGNSIGTLSAVSLSLNSDNTNAIGTFEFSGVDSTSDLIVLSGALTNGGGTNFIINFGGTGAVNQLYTLITFASTDFVSAASFSALNSAVPGTFILGANSLQYTTIAVPEPATWAMLAGVGALLAALRRRKS